MRVCVCVLVCPLLLGEERKVQISCPPRATHHPPRTSAAQTIRAHRECFLAYQAVAKQTYFMPLSLVIMGCMARCTAWMLPMQEALVDAYSVLEGWRRLVMQAVTAPPGGWELPPYHALLPPCLNVEQGDLLPLEVPAKLGPTPSGPSRSFSLSGDENDDDDNVAEGADPTAAHEDVLAPALNFFAPEPASVPIVPARPAVPDSRKRRRTGGDEIDDIFGI